MLLQKPKQLFCNAASSPGFLFSRGRHAGSAAAFADITHEAAPRLPPEVHLLLHERAARQGYTFVWQIRVGDYLYPVFVATTENEEVLTAEQRNLEYWNDMALKGTIYHQPEYKPSTPSQNQTGGTNHGSNGLRDEYDNPEDLYEDNPDWFEDEDEAWDEWEDG